MRNRNDINRDIIDENIEKPKEAKEKKKSHLGFFLFSSIGIISFAGAIAVSVFFFAVRGEEQTLVPDVVGKDIITALLELQEKELYPRIQLRYSHSPDDKGLILEQDPPVGTIVRAGRRIRLVVSQGEIVSVTENFIGRDIADVRRELLEHHIASDYQSIISLQEPFMYEYSERPAGTILHQAPKPGTSITGQTSVALVISRGQANRALEIPQLTGLQVESALEEIGRSGLNFSFRLRTLGQNEEPFKILAQDPAPQTRTSANTRVNLTVAFPSSADDGRIAAIFKHTIPKSPYPVPIQLEAMLPAGERRTLLSGNFMGGEFTVPYSLPTDSILVLYMLNREIHREIVKG